MISPEKKRQLFFILGSFKKNCIKLLNYRFLFVWGGLAFIIGKVDKVNLFSSYKNQDEGDKDL